MRIFQLTVQTRCPCSVAGLELLANGLHLYDQYSLTEIYRPEMLPTMTKCVIVKICTLVNGKLIIHGDTCSFCQVGITQPYGDIDYYPNWR